MAMTKAELETLERRVQEQRLVDQAARAADVHALGRDYRPTADEIAAIENNRLNANAQEMGACSERRAQIQGNPEMTSEEKAEACRLADAEMYARMNDHNAEALQQGTELYAKLPESVAVPYQESQENLQATYEAEKQQYELEQEQLQRAKEEEAKTIDQLDGPPGGSAPEQTQQQAQEREQEPEQQQQSKFVDLDQQRTQDAPPEREEPAQPEVASKFADLSEYQKTEPSSPERVPEQPELQTQQLGYEREDDFGR